jgi:hypothetical protein
MDQKDEGRGNPTDLVLVQKGHATPKFTLLSVWNWDCVPFSHIEWLRPGLEQ